MEKKISKESILTILFLALTFCTFFLKGMYFEGQQFRYLELLGLLSIAVFLLVSNRHTFGKTLDWFVAGMIAVYAISCFDAVYFRNAVVELIKYIGAFLVYLLTKKLLMQRKNWFMITVYTGGVIMSLVGLCGACGLLPIPTAYEADKNLVMSLFEYHNTSALFLACVFFFGLSLYGQTNKLWVKLLICAGNMIALMTVVFSQSRGTWVLFPIMFVLYLLLLPKGTRSQSLPVFGTFLSVLVILKGFGTALEQQNTWICMAYLLIAVIIATSVGLLLEKCSGKFTLNKKTILAIVVICIIVLLAFLLFGRYLLPQSMYERITSFTPDSHTVTERLTFYKDAMKMFKDHPWLGIGGGGWQYLTGQYQSYRYLAKSPHSFLLRLMVDNGILGILLFCYLVVVLVRLLIQLFRSNHTTRLEQTPIFTAVAYIFVHSMFDMNFSFYTMIVFVWMLLALLSDMESSTKQPQKTNLRWIGVVVAVAIALCGFVGRFAWNYYYKTAEVLYSDREQAYLFASKAAAVDPQNSSYATTKGNLAFHMAAAQTDEAQLRMYVETGEDALIKGYQSNPNDHLLIKQLAIFYVNTGRFEEGCDMVENMLLVKPLEVDSYQNVADVYTAVAQVYQQNNDMAGVKKAMSRLAVLDDETETYMKERNLEFSMNEHTKAAILQAETIVKQIEALEENE